MGAASEWQYITYQDYLSNALTQHIDIIERQVVEKILEKYTCYLTILQ